MQLTDKDGNIFGTGGLEITTSSGKPKVPVINTDITIGTTAVIGGVSGRVLYNNAGVVGELDLSSIYVPTSRTLTINGVTQDLSADRTFTISTGITIGSTAIASGVVGRVLFEGAGNVVQESSGLTYNDTTKTFTLIGPIGSIIQHTALTNYNGLGGIQLNVSDGTERAFFKLNPTSGEVRIGATGSGYFPTFYAQGVEAMRIFASTRNVAINTTTDAGFRFDVAGTARIQSTLSISNPSFTMGGSITHSANATLVITGGPGAGGENITFGPSNRIFINAQQSRFPTGSVQIAGTLSVGNQNATSTNVLLLGGSITAGSALGRGIGMDTTLVASANNDVLVGLDVQPTFTNGAFTGVANYNLRTRGLTTKQYFQSPTTNQGNHSISFGFGGAGEQVRLIASAAGAVGRGNLYIASASGDTAVATISDANALFAFAGNSFYKSFTIDQVSLTTGQGLYISGNQPASITNGIFFRYSETRVAILSKPHGANGYADFRIAIVPVGGANNPPQESDTKFMITKDTTNVLVNTTTDAGFKFDVNGTARINNIFYVTNPSYTGNIRIESIGNNQQRIVGAYGENITFGAGGNTININATETYVSGSFLGSGFWMQNNGATVLGAQAMAASSALLDIRSTTRGFLPPRMTNAQMLAISTPATGLMVYDTTNNKLCCYDGTTWQNLF